MRKVKVGTLKKHEASGLWFVNTAAKQKYLGTKATTEEEAQQLRQQLIDSVNIENAIQQERTDMLTVSGLLKYYLANAGLPEGTGCTRDRIRYVNRVMREFGPRTLMEVLPKDVEAWLKKLSPKLSDTSINGMCKHISAAFNWLLNNRKCSFNLMKGVARPMANARGEEYVVTPEEYERLLPTVKGTYRDIVECLWHTGARVGEILGAEKDEYDARTHQLRKKKHKTSKKKKHRNILLNQRAEEIIGKRCQAITSGLLFRSDAGKPISSTTMMQYMRRRFQEAGITHPCVNYSFRHTAAVRWLEEDIPVHVAAGLLGDTLAVFTGTYGHIEERIRNQRHLLKN